MSSSNNGFVIVVYVGVSFVSPTWRISGCAVWPRVGNYETAYKEHVTYPRSSSSIVVVTAVAAAVAVVAHGSAAAQE